MSPAVEGMRVTLTETFPLTVNFNEFETKFIKICLNLVMSPLMKAGTSLAMVYCNDRFFSTAFEASKSNVSSIHLFNANDFFSNSILADSIFEKSKMSLITERSASPLNTMLSTKSCCLLFSSV